jgi:hypothetical protein
LSLKVQRPALRVQRPALRVQRPALRVQFGITESAAPGGDVQFLKVLRNLFVGQGSIPHDELDAAVRRPRKAIIERALGGHIWVIPRAGGSSTTRRNHRDRRKSDVDRRPRVATLCVSDPARHPQ